MNQKKHIGYSIGLGIALGIVMSIIVILLLLMNAFSWRNLGFVLIALITISLPLCFNMLSKYGFQIQILQICMIVVSFVITIIYAFTVQNAGTFSTNLVDNVLKSSGILHALSLAGVLVSSFLYRRQK